MARKELVVKIAGDARGANQAFDQVEGGAGRIGRAFGAIATAAGTAFLAVGAAAGAAAVQGVREFASFERGMNEVFTLLPGVSQRAMGALQRDVRDFALEMGVATDDVVPALYQALSAGVPQGNVFDFLETAQQAAMGGVTTLETAVDGISSVVNAYGQDVIDAGQASDFMFTAVRLGKTTFDELAASLFNVNPTAAALGVNFGDVTAALATMTAQGVPTSVATTQLRQLFVELGDAGTDAGQAFEDVAGQSLQEFLAAGGDTADALAVMQQAADDLGVPIQQLFGSVEAGAAALSLTGANADSFNDALSGMADSSGATQAAFEQMDRGLSRVWDRVKVVLGELWLSIGEQLAPTLEGFGDWVQANMPQIQEAMAGALERIGGAVTTVIDTARAMYAWWQENGPGIVAAVQTTTDTVVTAFGTVVTAVQDVTAWFSATFGDDGQAAGELDEFAGELSGWVTQVTEIISSWIEVNRIAIETFLDAISWAWEKFGEDLVSFTMSAWDAIADLISGALDIIQGTIDFWLRVFEGDWRGAWESALQVLRGIWQLMTSQVDLFANAFFATINMALGAFGVDWEVSWDGIKQFHEDAWNDMVATFSRLWASLRGAYDTATSALSTAWGTFTGGIGKTWADLWGGIESGWGTISETMKGLVGGLVTSLGNIWDGIRNALGAPVNWIAEHVINRLVSGVNQVSRVLTGSNVLDALSIPLVPTFHEGGVVGVGGRMTGGPLRPGERIIKAKDGEEVLTADDPRHKANRVFAGFETDTFETGGPFDFIGDVLGSVAATARGVIADTVRPLFEGLLGPVESMAGQFGVPGEIVAGAGRKLVDAAMDWLAGVEDEIGPTLDTSGGWQALQAYLSGTGVPHRRTSDFRPGSITASGNRSRHSLGLAADFAAPTPTRAGYGAAGLRAIFEAFLPVASMLNELILTGAPFNIKRGRQVAPYAQSTHRDHVHAALAAGGIVTSPITALMGEAGPEAVIPLDDPRAATYLGATGFGEATGGFATTNPLQALIDLFAAAWERMTEDGRRGADAMIAEQQRGIDDLVQAHRDMWEQLTGDARDGRDDLALAFDEAIAAMPVLAAAVDALTGQVIAAAERATAAAAVAEAAASSASTAAAAAAAGPTSPSAGAPSGPDHFGRPTDPAQPTTGPYVRPAVGVHIPYSSPSADRFGAGAYADQLADAVNTAMGEVVDGTVARVIRGARAGVR